jgi:thiamine-phosphate pyrophosphorylase
MKKISKLHYITTGPALAEKACSGGVNWIQLRLKDIAYHDYRTVAREVQSVCRQYHCTLIINDNVELAFELGADGVHIGREDMSPGLARELLQEEKIIGCTSNTPADILELAARNIDYIGLGPYRYTSTKKNLSPLLGLDGYNTIFRQMSMMPLKLPPIVAIGGITVEDIPALAATGLHGVAVSGIISSAPDVSVKAGLLAGLCEQYFSR